MRPDDTSDDDDPDPGLRRPSRMPRGTEPAPPGAPAAGPRRGRAGPGRLTRWGLALAEPRWALAVADDPQHAGRPGTDLLVLFAALLAAVHVRALVGAVWLAARVDLMVGVRALGMIAARTFTTDLAFLVIGAALVFIVGGPRRALGRAFDLACAAIVPMVVVEAIASAVVREAGVEVPAAVAMIVTMSGFAWSGAILALALVQMRRAPRAVALPPAVARGGRMSGQGLAAALTVALVAGGVWVARNLDLLRPLVAGDPAPELALPRVGDKGALGERLTLSSLRGKVVVIEVWATWCGPCLQSMPVWASVAAKDRARGLEVVAIDIDDAAKARAIFDDAHYPMTLVYDDAGAADRLGVGPIPHAMVIDRDGVVRGVFRGETGAAIALAESLLR
jgi:thiol-disulfide isomerase/thioredoxin